MLYFSKLKITLIALFTLFMVMVSSSNFLDLDLDKQKKIKLGLDLQGGSQLLLQVETDEAIQEKLATQTEDIRTELLKADIQPQDLKLVNNIIFVKVNEDEIKKLENLVCKNNLPKKLSKKLLLISSSSPAHLSS